MQLISRIGGGLGNQMFIYAINERLSRALNATHLFDVTDYFVFKYLVPCGVHARKFELYDFKGPRRHKIWKAQYFFLLIWVVGKKAGWRAFEWIVTKLGLFWRHSEDVFAPKFSPVPQGVNTIYSTGINCDPTLLPDRDILMEEFALAKPLDVKAQNMERKILESESVSIHVRRTDYTIQPTSWEIPFIYYERAIAHMKRNVVTPKWFVFSDDPEWCRLHLAPILNDMVVVQGNSVQPSVDMHLMSQCKHHIIANSTFSWWGAYLTPDISGITLCPEYWGPYIEKLPASFYPSWWKIVKCK